MEKKQYIFPYVEVTVLYTKELMFSESISGGGTPENPAAQNGAPRRRTDVF